MVQMWCKVRVICVSYIAASLYPLMYELLGMYFQCSISYGPRRQVPGGFYYKSDMCAD